MAWLFVALVIAVPMAEIAVFVKVAQGIGFLAAVALAVAAGLVGLVLVRAQGLRTLLRAKSLAERGELPVSEIFDGLCVALAGGLLILPGFLSDLLALALLLPPVRLGLKAWLGRHFTVVQPGAGGPTIIDGDFTVVEPSDRRIAPHDGVRDL